MKIISGKTGSPHVTSQQFRQIMEGIIGDESYIIAGGENLEPELVSNNALKIRSGMLCHHGNVSCVDTGTYDEVELENGSQGMKRIDLVVNRYTRNEETGIESCDWVVLKGTPAESSPTVPEYTVGNLQNGDLVDDCPVFKVELDGIQVTGVMKMLSVLGSDLSDVSALKSKMEALGDYTPMIPFRGYSGDMNNMPTGTFLCELAKCTNAPSYPMGMWAHVICYAGFSQTAIFYNGTKYPPVIATRTYANNAWTAWAEQAQGFDFASVRINGLIDNALYVDLTNPYADVNKPRYVDRAKSATNMPTDCQWGIREVCQITSNWVMVRITGWSTGSQYAMWTNVYVNSEWQGWDRFSKSEPHVLWTGTGVFDAPTLTLNKNISFFKYYEIIYEVENGNNTVKSTGRIPIGNGATLDGINGKGLLMRRSTSAPSGTSLKLNSGGYFSSVNSSSSPYAGACCPRRIIGYI